VLTEIGNDGFYTFTAPVVPVTRTTSSNRVYLAFFRPRDGNFWEGNVIKLAISDGNEIVDSNGNPAFSESSESSRARVLREDAVPFWATIDWAETSKGNYTLNSNRNIYTYLGSSENLTVSANAFTRNNAALTAAVLGDPATHTPGEIIDYIRGADVFDEDGDGDFLENRSVITGDVIHSEPLVVDYNESLSVIYFGANDGMLHAVKDTPSTTSESDDGTEIWAFIPPDQLHRLKELLEGDGHLYFVDSSPKAYIQDVNGNGVIELDVDSDEDGDIDDDDQDRVVLVCGERKGGTSYFALDVTDPYMPVFLWRINQNNDAKALNLPAAGAPDAAIPALGESWSEPQFGLVRTSDEEDDPGTPVFFIGGGYDPDGSAGKAILAVRVNDGAVLKEFSGISGMNYSFPSSVTLVDGNSNGYVDKLYVGDLGGQMWRLGRFTDSEMNALGFPNSDENVNHWTGRILFRAGCAEENCINGADDNTNGKVDEFRQFFFPPSVTLENGYDLVFMGTGDREDLCNPVSSDRVYAVKDSHDSATSTEADLIDVSEDQGSPPDLSVYQGWYIRLAQGEKVSSEGVVFFKTFYVTTYLPGAGGTLYALDYKTGGSLSRFLSRRVWQGGGLLSKPNILINDEGQELLASRGGAQTDSSESQSVGPGILVVEPAAPPSNFFYLWWKEL
jgi:type IV pilus assembly protein PilY1